MDLSNKKSDLKKAIKLIKQNYTDTKGQRALLLDFIDYIEDDDRWGIGVDKNINIYKGSPYNTTEGLDKHRVVYMKLTKDRGVILNNYDHTCLWHNKSAESSRLKVQS